MDNKEFDFFQQDNASSEDVTVELDFLTESEMDDQVKDKLPFEDSKPMRRRARKGEKDKKPSWQKSLLMYIHDLIFLLASIIVIFLLLFRVVVVSGTSMNSTLLDGDYLLLLGNIFYRDPKPGDIIVASKQSFDNGAPIVKRVIATEGQTVDIDFNAGIVYVDGVALDEPYTLSPTNVKEGVQFPLVVDKGCLFVLGDNRNGSKDSRNPEIGLIDKREVLGKVIFLFLPGTNHGQENRDFGRIGVVS